jgi:hypothetical protein
MDTKELRRIGTRRQKAEREAAELAEQLRPLAVAALRDGMRPAEVVEITGWSAAQVRNIARTAGIGPARRGRAARKAEPITD